MNEPESKGKGNGVKDFTFGNVVDERPLTDTVTVHDSIIVVTPDSTGTKFITDTIFIPGKTDSIYIVTTEHDTILIEVGTTDTVFVDWVNKYSYGHEYSIVSGDTYADVEDFSWLDITKKDEQKHFDVNTTAAVKVRRATAEDKFLKNLGKSIKYLPPVIENNLTADVRTFDGGVVSRTERDVRLKMNDSYETVVPQYFEEAFIVDEGVTRQMPSFRITSTEYISHDDDIIEGDTTIKDGMVYQGIRRVAKIAAKMVVFPQVGAPFDTTVILTSDNTMDELKQKIYVEDHPYVEPTPKDTIPEDKPDTVPTTPDPDEPGYPFQGGKVKAAYFTYAIDMNNRIHEAILVVTESTLVPIVDSDYQMVSGTRYVYNPSEVTVSDNQAAYNAVSYNGGVVPAVLTDINGSLRWTYEGTVVCAMKDATLASMARQQTTTLTSTKLQDLSRKCQFKNVGNTTHIQTPYYTVVISK